MVPVDVDAITMGLENHCNEIIKLLRKIDNPKTKKTKTGAVICEILDKTMDSNLDILGILEATKLVLLSEEIIGMGLSMTIVKEAAKDE